ncbi:MAG: nucleotide exchange factor GrpE [Rickettsiales bacterium]|jgi:molecular chaperone GrpE|nr:nucleotide exchange factor GrpE [Rickettsiales bacterium]
MTREEFHRKFRDEEDDFKPRVDSSESEEYETSESKESGTEEHGEKDDTGARISESAKPIENGRLLEENANLKDKLLRTLAELENTRRRSAEEKDRVAKFALAGFIKDLIAVMENFYLAMASVGDGEGGENFEVFYSGIKLTFNELKKVFDRNNVKRIYPIDEQFNPSYHEAVTSIESNNISGTIVEVMQAGYTLNGRVVKPALVVVAK